MTLPARPFGNSFAERLRGWAQDRSLRATLLVFVLTRLFILCVFVGVAATTYDPNAPEFSADDPHPTVLVQPGKIMGALAHTIARGDAAWYGGIAAHGYDRVPFEARTQHNWAFFPLYPLLMRAAGAWSGQYLVAGVGSPGTELEFAL